jgi:TadE-like protein
MSVATNLTEQLSRMASRAWTCLRDRRGAFALEFALVAPIFFVLLFVVFEVSYDEFMQEVLDSTVQSAARQVQIGNTQTATNSTFVASYMCPYDSGLMNCNNLFVRIQEVSFGNGSCPLATADFYDATPLSLPISNGVVQLANFYNGAGAAGTGGPMNLSPCATTGSSSGFCNAGPQQLILMTGVYVAPSFLGGLVLRNMSYGGNYVRALYSTAAFVTESFSSTSPSNRCS